MKWLLIIAILFGAPYAARAAEESLGTKIKKAFEPSPTPTRKHRKKKPTPTPSPETSPKRKKASPSPSPTATPKSKSKRKRTTPTPTPEPEESPSATPAQTPARGKKGWPNVSLSPDQISGYESVSAKSSPNPGRRARANKTKSRLHLWFCRSRERRHGLFRFHLLRP